MNILLRGGAGVNLAMNVSNDKLSLTIHIVIENMLVKVKEYGQDLVCMTVTIDLKCLYTCHRAIEIVHKTQHHRQ